MSYIVQSDLKGLIPDEYLAEALDDDASGVADTGLWAAIAAAVDEEIDGRIGGRYATPVSPAPAAIKSAARALACYLAYQRRGVADDANPWTEQAKDWRKRLDAIGKGDEPLRHDATPAEPGVTVVTEAARMEDGSGRMMV